MKSLDAHQKGLFFALVDEQDPNRDTKKVSNSHFQTRTPRDKKEHRFNIGENRTSLCGTRLVAHLSFAHGSRKLCTGQAAISIGIHLGQHKLNSRAFIDTYVDHLHRVHLKSN